MYSVRFLIALAGLVSSATFAATIDSTISTTAGTKPEFYLNSGQYMTVTGIFSYTAKNDWNYSLSQSATSVREVQTRGDEGAWFGNTRITAIAPTLYQTKRNISTFSLSSAPLQRTQLARETTQFADVSASLSHTHTYKKWSLTSSLSLQRVFYELTLSEDGRRNHPYQTSWSNGVGYSPWSFLNLGASYALIRRDFFEGEPGFFYSLQLNATANINKHTTVSAGLVTTDSQLRGTDPAPVYAYREDLSEAYVSVSYRI